MVHDTFVYSLPFIAITNFRYYCKVVFSLLQLQMQNLFVQKNEKKIDSFYTK